MRYEKQSVLTSDANPFGGTDHEQPEFLRGVDAVLEWEGGHDDRGGSESHSLYSAFSAEHGGRCWYHSWCFGTSERGNTSTGYGSELLSFREGVEKFLELDVFAFPEPINATMADGIHLSESGGDPGLMVHCECQDCGRRHEAALGELVERVPAARKPGPGEGAGPDWAEAFENAARLVRSQIRVSEP